MNAPRSVHIHVLYTVPPSSTTTFARSRLPTRVKVHPQMKGASDRWASCTLGDVVKTVVASSPSLLPTPQTDYSLHLTNPKQTHRESLYNPKPSASTSPVKPVEVQSGLLGWALDDASKESESLVMGILRRDEMEGEEDEQDEGDVEEWLEIRLTLVSTKPVSHAQHLSHLSFLHRGLAPPSAVGTPVSSGSTSPTLTRSSLNSSLLTSGPSHHRKSSHPSSSSSSTPIFKQPLLPTKSSADPFTHPTASSTPLATNPTFDPFQAPPSSRTTKRVHSPSHHHSSQHPLPPDGPSSGSQTPAPPVKRGRGRPPGATNKLKPNAGAGKRSSSTSTYASNPKNKARAFSVSQPAKPKQARSTTTLLTATKSNPNPTLTASPPDLLQAATENFTAFTPQLVDLLNLINRDVKVTDDKETAGILKSLLDAAHAAEGTADAGGGSGEDADSPLAGLGAGGSTRLGHAAHRKDAILNSAEGNAAGSLGRKRKTTGDPPDLFNQTLLPGPGRNRKTTGPPGPGPARAKVDGEGCENCGSLTSISWKKKEGCGKACDACGLYYNRHKVKRPKELWGDLSMHMESSPEHPLDIRSFPPPSPSNPMHKTSPVRGSFRSQFSYHHHSHSGDYPSNPRYPPASPLRDVRAMPMTSPVRSVRRSMSQQTYESPRTALKKMLAGGPSGEIRRLSKPLSNEGAMGSAPTSDVTLRGTAPRVELGASLSVSEVMEGAGTGGLHSGDGLSTMLGSNVQSDITMTDAEWLHSDFSSFFEFGNEEPEEMDQLHSPTPKKARLSTPRRNGIHEPRSTGHLIPSSSPMPAPFDFSSLPPSSPPVIPSGLFSSPNITTNRHQELDLHKSMFSLLDEGGSASTPASAASFDTEHSLADVEALQSLFAESPASGEENGSPGKPLWGATPPSSTTSTEVPSSSAMFDSSLLLIPEISTAATSPATSNSSNSSLKKLAAANPDPPSREQQLEFLALWEQCQNVAKSPPPPSQGIGVRDVLSRRGSMAVGGSSPDNGTPPTWVADES